MDYAAGFQEFRYAVYRARVVGVDFRFWAAAEADDVMLEGREKDGDFAEEGLVADLFVDVHNDHIGEHIRCGMVFDCVPAVCAALRDLQSERVLSPTTRVLELGAGMGLPGLWAAANGMQTVVSDRHPGVLELLTRNAKFLPDSAGSVEVHSLSWSDRPPWLRNFDVVLAADVLYEAVAAPSFFGAAGVSLRSGGLLLLGYKERQIVKFSTDVLPIALACGFKLCRGNEPQNGDIEVFVLEKIEE